MATVQIAQNTLETLQALAKEANKSPEDFLAALIEHEDKERHVGWSRSQRKFVRHKCTYANCQEKQTLPFGDIAD